MLIHKRILFSTCAVAAMAGSLICAPLPPDEAKADNTAANKQAGKTADDQKETAQDRKISQEIRKALMKDKSLSTYAHNVKIVTVNGTVTLRGPVRSQEEIASVESAAKQVAGVSSVANELTVAAK